MFLIDRFSPSVDVSGPNAMRQFWVEGDRTGKIKAMAWLWYHVRMSLLNLLLIIAAVGVLVWLIQQAPFIAPQYKRIATWVAVIVTILWLVSSLGFLDPIANVHVGRVHGH